MKKRNTFVVFSLIIFLSGLLIPQSNTFTIEAYKQFLSTHQNMDAGQLLQMHNARTFLKQVPLQTQALFLDSITIKYKLTSYEQSLIEKNGFMVSDRLKTNSVGEAFIDVFRKDLPLFISTDAILHSLHLSYDNILKDVELGYIIPKLKTILDAVHQQLPVLQTRYAANPGMTKSLEDIDLYLCVAKTLLGSSNSAYYSVNASKRFEIMKLIGSYSLKSYALFSENCRDIDFSQFKVRGHYTDEYRPELGRYFQSMMWLGRTEFYLIRPNADPLSCPRQTDADIQRQIIDALLLSEMLNLSGSQTMFDEIDDVIKFFVGESDNVTFTNLTYLKNAVQINDPSDLLDTNRVKDFQNELKKNDFAYQRILSQVLVSTEVDSIVPASAFLFLGQRFIIDSYVFSQVTYDRIKYNNTFIRRMLPNSLDVLFALGNDAAGQLLQPELEQYHYSTNLASLRYLVDAYSDDFWKSSMYNAWLQGIRSLNPPAERTTLPSFMQTAAYWQSKMNTQLASWAQLRHDNLLYGKQSYSGGTTCSFPFVYVEPFPQLYKSLKQYAAIAKQKFQMLTFSQDYYKEPMLKYFQRLYEISDTLGTIAEKELISQKLTADETKFLECTITLNSWPACGEPMYDGWIFSLFYGSSLENETVVADVHTAPTDESGNVVGWVKHVGTGMMNLGVWVTNNGDAQPTAYVGPALSYYEYTSTNFLRLTDEEWQASYLNAALRPSFVNLYLADSSGNTKGNGPMLLTSIEKNNTSVSDMNYLIAQNYPNPFNPSTIISFTIPDAMANQKVSLKIFSINGELIKTFFEKELPAGNYVTRWDGTNEIGSAVPSGIYLYKLSAGNTFVTEKMSLVK
ncbi:MAG: DUF3160 domain-containing protein [Ignavibacteriaceae bacterium]|nr:DUF3160 domain-containing protein [Ignavibacteriaceae bacterium]